MKRLVKLLTLAAVVAAVVAVLKRRPAPPSASPTAPPSPATPVAASAPAPAEPTTPASATPEPEPEPAATGDAGWADPTAEGGCPEGYPVKAKLKSRIFHVPGGVLYERTVPDRCYPSAEAAEADGLRASLR